MALSLQQFTEQLTASGLLSPDELTQVIQGAAAQPRDVEQFARLLIQQQKLTAFQAQQIYAGKGKSLVLGNYVILDKLGQGGMGMVLKARHRRMNRLVALKVLSPAVTKSPELVARFQREVQAAARLEHPNIVSAYDADEANGTHFFVMQYVEGNDLSSVVKKSGPMEVSQAVDCILQAARGLEYAHKQGVIHRDIKPANLLLSKDGVVKILDMGLARIAGDTGQQAELTNTGAVMGTVDYMAPEQALSTKHADARSDVYSLGITLWYLLTGKPAYMGDSLMARMLAHRDAPIPLLKEERADVPSSLAALFQRMVAKRSEERFQSMTEVVAALEACRSGDESKPTALTPIQSRDPSEDSRPGAFSEGLSASGASRPSGTQPTRSAVASRPVTDSSAYEATVTSAEAGFATDPVTIISRQDIAWNDLHKAAKKKRTARKWWLDRNIQIGGGIVGLLLVTLLVLWTAGIIFKVETEHGTLVIKVTGDNFATTVQGEEVTIRNTATDETFTIKLERPETTYRDLAPGDYEFELTTNSGLRTETKRFEITGDEDVEVEVWWEPIVANSASGTTETVESSQPRARGLRFSEPFSHVAVPTVQWNPDTPMTIEAWVRPGSLEHSGYVASVAAFGNFDLKLNPAIDNWEWILWDSANRQLHAIQSTAPLEAGQRMHIAGTRDPDAGLRLFVNGVEQTKMIGTYTREHAKNCFESSINGHLVIGGMPQEWVPTEMSTCFGGVIEQLRISESILYDGNTPPPTVLGRNDDTIALYDFVHHAGADDVLTDLSGGEHHGQIVGAMWVETTASGSLVTVQPLPAGRFEVTAPGYSATIAATGLIESVRSGENTLIESTTFGAMGNPAWGAVTAEHSGTTLTFTQGSDYRLSYDFQPGHFTVNARVSTAAAERDGIDGKSHYLTHVTHFSQDGRHVTPLDGPPGFDLPAAQEVQTRHFVVDFNGGKQIEVETGQADHAAFVFPGGPYAWGRPHLQLDADNEIRFGIRSPADIASGTYARDREAAEWALSIGGKVSIVRVDASNEPELIETPGSLPSEDFYLSNLDMKPATERYDGADLQRIGGLPGLQIISITDTGERSSGILDYLLQCPRLRQVNISGNRLVSSDFPRLAGLRDLYRLSISHDQIDDGWDFARQLPSLRELRMFGASIPEIHDLADLSHLHTIEFTQVAELDAEFIAELQGTNPNLRIVTGLTSNRRIQGRDPVAEAAALLAGRGWILEGSLFSGEDWASQAAPWEQGAGFLLTNVTAPPNRPLDDDELDLLPRLSSNFYRLTLRGLRDADLAVPAIVSCGNIGYVDLTHSDLTDDGLSRLNASFLSVRGTQVTRDGVESLKRRLPWCMIGSDFGTLGYEHRFPEEWENETSLAFDGVDDYVEIPLTDFPASGPLTVEAWFTAPEAHPDYIVHVAQLATNERVVELSIGNGLLKTFYRDPGRFSHLGDVQSVLGRRHVAVVWDGEQMSQFVDGKLIGRGSVSGTQPWHFADVAPTLVMGAQVSGIDAPSAYVQVNTGHLFHGSLHAFRVTESVVYSDEFTPPGELELTPETLALFDFSRDTGETLMDLSEHGRNGTIHGATWTSGESP